MTVTNEELMRLKRKEISKFKKKCRINLDEIAIEAKNCLSTKKKLTSLV